MGWRKNNPNIEIPPNPMRSGDYSEDIKTVVIKIFEKFKNEVKRKFPSKEYVENCIALYGVDLVIEAINDSLKILPGNKQAFYSNGSFVANLSKIIETCDAQDVLNCSGIITGNVKFIPKTCIERALNEFHHALDLER